ncbi:hypothetical protein MMC14_001113 [Varicellaria rhodocarpa]|nr:hypothetical protein [Varicellaria rhodocarpa]
MSNYQNKAVTSQEQYPPQYQNNTYAQGTEITPMSSQPQMQQPMNEKHEYTAQERGQSYTGQQPQQTPGVSMPMPQQQQQPQQSMAQGQQYQTAIPLYALGPGPAPVDCPVCHVRALTRVEYETGNTT